MTQEPPDAGLHTSTRARASGAAPFTRLGRYQLVSRIATGGMAEVYLARHGELAGFRTLVIVKRVLPHLASRSEFIAMFLDEARIVSLLDHPNVVRIFEVGRNGDEYFLAMELVQGQPLATLMRRAIKQRQNLDPRIVAFIVAQAAAGLHHAHGLAGPDGKPLGLVHRDVSPQNILISFEGAVKVIDFGIARARGRLTETDTGSRKGKAGYMSPEQARGEAVDHRTDIFALGVVLWEALCGRPLFTGNNEVAILNALVHGPIPRPTLEPPLPPTLEAIVMRALSRDPAARFPSAQDMSAQLEEFVFAAGGAGTGDVAALMKATFAPEQIEWRNAARVALDKDAPDPDGVVTSPGAPDGPPTRAESGRNPTARSSRPEGLIATASHRRIMLTVAAGVLLILAVAATVSMLGPRRPEPVSTAPTSLTKTPGPVSPPTPPASAAPPAPPPTITPASPGRPLHPAPTRPDRLRTGGSPPLDLRPNPF